MAAQHEFEVTGCCFLGGLNVIAPNVFVTSVTVLRTSMLQALFQIVLCLAVDQKCRKQTQWLHFKRFNGEILSLKVRNISWGRGIMDLIQRLSGYGDKGGWGRWWRGRWSAGQSRPVDAYLFHNLLLWKLCKLQPFSLCFEPYT